MANTKQGGRRRRPPRRIREHRRRAAERHAPGYELVMQLHAARDWNLDPRRVRLGERACPSDHDTLLVETRPRDRNRRDDGVLVVAHVPCDDDVDELVDAFVRATMTVMAMMNKKFGRAGWWPAAITGPGWLLAELDQRVRLPQA